MIRPRSPYPPMHLIQSGRIRVGGPKGPPNGARMSPPLRHMPMFYRMPSPTAGLIRVTPRHLPPTAYRMNMGNRPRMLTPSPIQNQRYEYEIFSGDNSKWGGGIFIFPFLILKHYWGEDIITSINLHKNDKIKTKGMNLVFCFFIPRL